MLAPQRDHCATPLKNGSRCRLELLTSREGRRYACSPSNLLVSTVITGLEAAQIRCQSLLYAPTLLYPLYFARSGPLAVCASLAPEPLQSNPRTVAFVSTVSQCSHSFRSRTRHTRRVSEEVPVSFGISFCYFRSARSFPSACFCHCSSFSFGPASPRGAAVRCRRPWKASQVLFVFLFYYSYLALHYRRLF
ncbi:hypothetical protein B0H11DRAFT_2148580 [Mycena galericulata]|nr:hypothetical protein B0H11DRAFT_2148580 [Mycena galericulata]